MSIPTRELVFDEPDTALAKAETPALTMFERLASDPTVPVDKLEKLIELQERIMRHNAKAEFYAAFAAMQGEIPTISERGEILVNGQLRSKYARNEDIQGAVRPILQKHGFALSFRNEFKDGLLTITGILSHRSGHSEQDTFAAKADSSGGKNEVQALGSTRAYGQRYTTLALLNIATTGEDDDAHGAVKKDQPKAADGYQDWLDNLTAVAENGWAAFDDAWQKSKPEFRNHLTKTDAIALARLKTKARGVK